MVEEARGLLVPSPMSSRIYYNAQSEDQATYLEMMALIKAKKEALEEVFRHSSKLAKLHGGSRRLYEAIEEYGIATRQARNIYWHEAIGGWYYRD